MFGICDDPKNLRFNTILNINTFFYICLHNLLFQALLKFLMPKNRQCLKASLFREGLLE